MGGEPFEQLQPAAALLTRFNRHSDAVAFLTERVRAVPWDAAARVALGRANRAAGSAAAESRQALAGVAGSTETSYDVRADAAKALSGAGGPDESRRGGCAESTVFRENPGFGDSPLGGLDAVTAGE